jgi:FkbM family methyltransferase
MLSLTFLRARKVIAALRFPLTRRALLRHRVLAAFEHRYPLTLERFMTIVDVGANRGQFSLAARTLNPDANLIAFEPLPEPASIFESVLRNDPSTVLHRLALADRNGTGQMHVSKKADSSSLLPIGALQVSLFPQSVEIGTSQVPLRRLDQLIDHADIRSPALLKIDVQGFELGVLQGCIGALARFDHVYVECSFVRLYDGQPVAEDVIRFLDGHGFRLRGAYNIFLDANGQSIQGDLLFSDAARRPG